MRAAICDDESYWRESLKNYINEYERKNHVDIVVDYFPDGVSLLLSPLKFDVIFMDYQMNNLDGIETVRKIRASNNKCAVIFVSAYPNVAIDTFEVNTFRFLTKPIDKEKLFKSLDDYLKQEKEQFLFFKTHDRNFKINEADIIYCESSQRHTIIHTWTNDYEILINIREVEKLLSKEKFMRCHKSYIISFYHIRAYDNYEIMLDNNCKAYIGRKYRENFKKSIAKYTLNNNIDMS